MRFYSPSTQGFYDSALHGGAIPADAVKITEAKHAKLLDAHAAGAEIVMTEKGPVARQSVAPLEAVLAHAIKRVKREARRRIEEFAPAWRQSNDNATLASGSKDDADFAGALERRQRINAIRAASNSIEATLPTMTRAELERFSAHINPAWPKH